MSENHWIYKTIQSALKRIRPASGDGTIHEDLKRQYEALSIEPGVIIKSRERLRLGRHNLIQRGTVLHCGGMEWCNYKGHIHLGDFVEISPYCIFYGSGGIEADDYCRFGPGVKLMSQAEVLSQDPETPTPEFQLELIKLGKACLVGAGAVILGGTTLGDYCVVGPNAVVKGHYSERCTLIGNPARAVPRQAF
ncbi:MAG: acyltransferase [Bacteroidia bacterium]